MLDYILPKTEHDGRSAAEVDKFRTSVPGLTEPAMKFTEGEERSSSGPWGGDLGGGGREGQ